jgi:hypothetical protein
MKRSLIYIFFVSVLLFAFFSCEEEEVSKKHEYTAEEKAYRDSVEAAKAGVKADFIITQDVKVTYGNWSNVEVPLEVATMCEKLGYADADALKTAIGAFDGEVELLAVNLVTKADFSDHVIDEAGVQEGFVFSKAGEPGAAWDWPTEASQQLYNMWCVYNVNNFAFTIGMRTGVLESGKTYKIAILWKKGDYRLATIFNISPAEPEEDPNAYVADTTFTKNVMLVSSSVENNAKVVATLDGAALARKLGYADAAALSTALGNVEWNTQVNNQVKFFGVNASTGIDYANNYTAGMGYWYTIDGDICSYSSNDAALYAELDPATFKITIGQKGGRVTNGKTYKLIVMFANTNEYRVALVFNVSIVVDTPPAGDPYEVSVTHTIVHPITTGWEQDYIDVTGILRDAFKMTTADIYSAISGKTMNFYAIDPNDQSHKTSTAGGNDYPGHWINADGTMATNYADGEIFIQMVASTENIRFMFLNHPSNITNATTITVKQVAELNGGKVNFTFNVVLINGSAVPYETTYKRNVDHIANSDYTTTDIDVTDIVTHAFKKTVTEIGSAIGSSGLEFYAINADNSHSNSTGEYPGHWFDATGTARGWGDGAFGCINLKIENERIILKVYNFPGVTSGMATMHQVAKLNGGQVNFEISINLK